MLQVFFLVVVFGLFNGLGLLPVILSWIGPAPYLNARQQPESPNQSISLKDISGTNTDLNRLLTQNNRKKSVTQTSNIEKVEQYIDSLPDRQVSTYCKCRLFSGEKTKVFCSKMQDFK